MKTRFSLFVLAGFVAGGMAHAASAVSIQVETQSRNDKTQTGSITIVTDDGRTLTGHVTGRIVRTDPAGFPVYLDHVVAVHSMGTFHTTEDIGFPMGAPSGCSVPVQEIMNIDKGTGEFKNISANVTMVGTLDVCTGRNVFSMAPGSSLTW